MTSGVVANLDVESVASGRRLTASLLQRLSAVGSLLRVFAEPDEPLWTPRPVDPHRVLPVEGLARPVFVDGEQAMPPEPRMTWCAHQDRALLSRRVDHDAERSLADCLPGCRWVESVHQLDEVLRDAVYGAVGGWVLKPAFSAAGQGALRGRDAAMRDGTPVASSPAVAALLEEPRHGALLEPWVERLDDFGCRARIEHGRVAIDGCHRLLVTASGGFRGVEVPGADGVVPGLADQESAQLLAATVAAGARLAALGHRGPFGVDAFAYRGVDGERRFRAQCEINARHTFGFVAAALAQRVGRARDWAADSRVSLLFGKGPVPRRAEVPLLAPSADHEKQGDDCSAWLEVECPTR